MTSTLFNLPLGPREREILLLLADGWEGPQISEKLFISESTVKTHKQKMFQKLGARNSTQAVHLAHLRGDLSAATVLAEDVQVAQHARQLGRRLALVPLGDAS